MPSLGPKKINKSRMQFICILLYVNFYQLWLPFCFDVLIKSFNISIAFPPTWENILILRNWPLVYFMKTKAENLFRLRAILTSLTNFPISVYPSVASQNTWLAFSLCI